jgi:hypothetical protein
MLVSKRTAVLTVLSLAGFVACSDFLDVSDPGRYTDDALNTPLALTAVANGVEGDVLGDLDNLAYAFGEMSDEYMATGTWNPDFDVDQGRTPTITNNGTGQTQTSFLNNRTAAQKAQERFKTVMGDSADRSLLMSRVVAMEAWSNLFLGMYNCESPVGPDGEIVNDIEMYKLSIPLFTKAAAIAKAANNVVYERLAVAGRARANLFAGNLDAALADAQTIPDSYVFSGKYSNAGGAPQNYVASVSYRTRLKAAGLDQRHWSKVDTIAGFMRDPYGGGLDRRMPFTHPANDRGADGVTQHYNQEKYKDTADDIPLTHGKEMRLIEAEVYMKKGDLVKAMERINYTRNLGGMPPVTGMTTAAQVQEVLLWERFVNLYLEGQRMNDLHRFNLVRSVLGPNRPTKFPLTTSEIQLNTHVNGSLQGRCLPMSGA